MVWMVIFSGFLRLNIVKRTNVLKVCVLVLPKEKDIIKRTF